MNAAQARVLRHLGLGALAALLVFLSGWLKNDSVGLLEPSVAGLLALAAQELTAFVTAHE